MKTHQKPIVEPAEVPFDPDIDRPAELDELNFNEENKTSFQDVVPDADIGLFEEGEDDRTLNDTVDNPSTKDDLSPEILIPEDGSRSPYEPGGSTPQDESLSIVNEDEIGEGYGLDEAELARVDPLDGKKDTTE